MTLSDYYWRQLFSSSSPFAREERDERKMARCRVPYYKYAKRTRVGSFVSNFSSEPQRSFVITSPPQNTSNRGRESKNDTYSLSIIAEWGVCQKPPQTPLHHAQKRRVIECAACVIWFFFLICPKTLNGFLSLSLFAFEKENFSHKKQHVKKGLFGRRDRTSSLQQQRNFKSPKKVWLL